MRLAQAACKTPAGKQTLVEFVTELLKNHAELHDGSTHLDDGDFDADGRPVPPGTADRQELARIAHRVAILQLAAAVIETAVAALSLITRCNTSIRNQPSSAMHHNLPTSRHYASLAVLLYNSSLRKTEDLQAFFCKDRRPGTPTESAPNAHAALLIERSHVL